MAVVERTTTTYGQNLKNKFGGVVTGVILFIASFVILWLSQAQVNYGKLAQKKSVEVSAQSVDTANENVFVSVTGDLVADTTLGDPEFIRAGDYLAISRTVEMYAWVEKSKSETHEKVGGGSETVTTYWNEKEWTTHPQDSTKFHDQSGLTPQNPTAMPYESADFAVASSHVGAFSVESSADGFLPPAGQALTPTIQNTILNLNRRIDGNYIFQGKGSLANPQIGDVRISFKVLPNKTYVTVFGKQVGSTVRRWTDPKKSKVSLFRAIEGDREQAIAAMKQEYKTLVWILTIAGFLAMWIGLQMMFGFIPGLLQVLPFLKDASQFIIGLVLFPLALVLSLIVIGISAAAHNLIVLIAVIAVVVILIVLLATRKKAPQAPQA